MVYGAKKFFFALSIFLTALITFGVDGFHTKLPSAARMLIVDGEGPTWSPAPASPHAKLDLIYTPDFNNDRFGDIAALAPSYDVSNLGPTFPNAGAVNAIYGNATGIGTKGNRQLILDGIYLQANTFHGASAALGDINNDLRTDVIAGVPGALYGAPGGGAIAYWRSTGKDFELDKVINGDRANAFLGTEVATGDFNCDHFFDVAAAAPGDTVNGKRNAGSVSIYHGPDLNLSGRFTLASAGIKEGPNADDHFGSALFSADINNDTCYDLIIGSGSANGRRGHVNILYGRNSGLGSAGNQLVKLTNQTVGDFFGFDVYSAYVNNDSFPEVIMTVPGLANNTGAAFLIDGGPNGLTNRSAFLQSPTAREGDRFGYAISGIGYEGMYVFAFGSPGADYTGVQDSGRVDLFNIYSNKWSAFLVGGGNLFGREFGKSLAFTANLKNENYFLGAGAPGGTVSGEDNAGFFVDAKLNFKLGGTYSLNNRKTFHLNKLAGENQQDGEFSNGFAVFPSVRD